MKADPALAGLPVVGPAFALGDRRAVGDLSQWLDYGNMHSYPGNRNPEWSLEPHGGNEFGLAAIISGDKPVVATETGYHNAVQSPEGHAPVSERASGIYVPRLLLDNFAQQSATRADREAQLPVRADRRGHEPHVLQHRFGLLRSDLSEKPAYKALKNLLALLEDPGPAFDLGSLDYSLEGDDERRPPAAAAEAGRVVLCSPCGAQVDVWDEASGGDLYPCRAARDPAAGAAGRARERLPARRIRDPVRVMA